MGSCVILDRATFPSQDIRYTGRGTGAKPKVRKDLMLAPNFLKPKVPVPSNVVPDPAEGDHIMEGEQTVEGEQAVVEPAGRVTLCSCEGNPCVCGGFVCKSVTGDFVCPNQVSADANPERSVVAYTPPNTRGDLCIVINM